MIVRFSGQPYKDTHQRYIVPYHIIEVIDMYYLDGVCHLHSLISDYSFSMTIDSYNSLCDTLFIKGYATLHGERIEC